MGIKKSISGFFMRIFGKPMDPIKIFPKKVMEHILSFVRGNDLLRLSLVSKDWYKFIANSSICMEKIKIHITEYFLYQKRSFTIADALILYENGRKYEHLSIACLVGTHQNRQEFSPCHKLLMAFFKWKSISLCNHAFQDEMEFVNFMGFLEPFVEDLELRTVKIKDFIGICKVNFEFPHLKVLRLINVANFVFTEPFKNVHKLQELSVATEPFVPFYVDHSDQIKERVKSITKMLISNRRIKDLELFIDQKDFDNMFVNRLIVSQIEFKLRTLNIGRFKKLTVDRGNIFQIRNFVRFLQQHKTSMQEIFIPDYVGFEVLEVVINDLKVLRICTIQDIESYEDTNKLNLRPNYNIKNLTIITKRFNGLISMILSNLPNLRHLDTGTIDQRIFNTLAAKTPFLESIVVDYFIASTPPKLPVLKNLKHMSIIIKSADNFMTMIGVKNEYTNFEKVFLHSAKALLRKWDVNSKSFYRC